MAEALFFNIFSSRRTILETFIFSPIDNAYAIWAVHQFIASNQFIEPLRWNIQVACLAHTLNNRADDYSALSLPYKIVLF
jgi:hypothetical protein